MTSSPIGPDGMGQHLLRTVSQRELIKAVVEALEETGLRPEGLMLEIPEQVFAGEAEPAVTNPRVLKDVKVHVVITNFGTSYSPFSYLKRFPLTRVKLDRSPILRFSQEPRPQPS